MKKIRLPLAQRIENRGPSTNTDGRTVNAYFDTEGDKRWVVKRPGFSPLVLSPVIPAGTGQGMFPFQSNLWAIVGNILYMANLSSGGTVPAIPSNRVVNKSALNRITLG